MNVQWKWLQFPEYGEDLVIIIPILAPWNRAGGDHSPIFGLEPWHWMKQLAMERSPGGGSMGHETINTPETTSQWLLWYSQQTWTFLNSPRRAARPLTGKRGHVGWGGCFPTLCGLLFLLKGETLDYNAKLFLKTLEMFVSYFNMSISLTMLSSVGLSIPDRHLPGSVLFRLWIQTATKIERVQKEWQSNTIGSFSPVKLVISCLCFKVMTSYTCSLYPTTYFYNHSLATWASCSLHSLTLRVLPCFSLVFLCVFNGMSPILYVFVQIKWENGLKTIIQ